MSVPRTARARVRAQITAEILGAAGEELAASGAAALSVRAVARRLGMVPSALYRYFESRDHLLTALIIEAYQDVGRVAAETDESGAAGGHDRMGRWLAVCRAVRSWAHANPHRWALIYGSPVPGYEAPEITVEAALALTRVVAGLLPPPDRALPAQAVFPPVPDGLDQVVSPMRDQLMAGSSPGAVVAALMAWTALVGTVSLELFGHFKGGTTDFGAVFSYEMELVGRVAGFG